MSHATQSYDFGNAQAAYAELARDLSALLASERDLVANAANTAALVYGAVGHLNYHAIKLFLIGDAANGFNTIALIGFALVGVGLAFKLALVPFQAWLPDVYQGAPTPVTAFMSSAT